VCGPHIIVTITIRKINKFSAVLFEKEEEGSC